MLIELNKEIMQSLTKTESEIIKFINDNEGRMSELSIVDIALDTYSSPATVSRAIRKCGVNGFNELRYRLTSKTLNDEICNMGEIINKSFIEARQVVDRISVTNVLNIIDCLVKAKKIYVLARGLIDHGNSFELAMKAYRTGYTSIMIDGSHGSFEDNIALTKSVVDVCKNGNVPVEAELGKVGGKEDDLDGGDGGYTDPKEAKEFVEKTGVDSLAVAIGTAHGVYKGEPNLDLNRLSEIRELVDIPLVLHGTSGVSDEVVTECVNRGICKVNYATDLRIAFTKGVRKVLDENPDTIDPKKYNSQCREEVKEYVKSKMIVVKSAGQAS